MNTKTHKKSFKTSVVPVLKPGRPEVFSSKVDYLVGHPAMIGHQSSTLTVKRLSNGLPAGALQAYRKTQLKSNCPLKLSISVICQDLS